MQTNTKKITKAILPAAGLGTRFLPATKTVPKEMLTLVDAPIIFYVVEEALNAGIEDIVLIQGRGKTAIEDFFDISYELEDRLAKANRIDLLKRLEKIRDNINIISIRQKNPLGLGHAVLCAESVIGKQPFAVLLGDEILVESPSRNTLLELGNAFLETGCSAVSVMNVDDKDVNKYGIAEVTERANSLFQVSRLVEKPQPHEIKSRWALPGRYMLDAKIFDHLRNLKPTVNNEIQLTDALNKLAQNGELVASPLAAKRFDAGDKLGFIKANVELALLSPEIGKDFKSYLSKLVSDF